MKAERGVVPRGNLPLSVAVHEALRYALPCVAPPRDGPVELTEEGSLIDLDGGMESTHRGGQRLPHVLVEVVDDLFDLDLGHAPSLICR